VLPTIITQLLSGRRRLELGALTPTRDFTFVSDTAQAFIKAVQSKKGIGEVINVGSNFEISVGDVVKLVSEVMGVSVEVEQKSERLRPEDSEVERLWADSSKALALIGWKPEFAGREGFRRGIGATVAWFRGRTEASPVEGYTI
jgi:dTDP-glucose 4,6-dehydratase